MKRYKTTRMITSILLIAYLFSLICLRLSKVSSEPTEVIAFRLFRDISEQNDTYLAEAVYLLLLFIPIGILYPLTKGGKCCSETLSVGIAIVVIHECFKVYQYAGILCMDDILLALLGTFLGYRIFHFMSQKLALLFKYRWTRDNKSKSWITCLVLVFVCLIMLNRSITRPLESKQVNQESFQDTQLQKVYDKLYTNLSNYEVSIVIQNPSLDCESVYDQFMKVLNDHPELFWLTGGAETQTITTGSLTTIIFKPNVTGSKDEIQQKAERLNANVEAFLRECPSGYSDYEKALWVHDVLVRNVEYDEDTYYASMSMVDNSEFFSDSYTAYGCLVNRIAVCSGYAKAYKLLLNKMDIECGYVTGVARNFIASDGHAWNYIGLDDEYYYVDVTWDDPVGGNSRRDISHDYFCLTSQEMLRDHTPDANQDIPECNGTKYAQSD